MAVEKKLHYFLPRTGMLSAGCWLMDQSLCLHRWQGLLQTPSHHWFDHVEMREDVALKPWMPFTLRLLVRGCCAAWALQYSLPGWNDLIRWLQRAGWSTATCFLRKRVSSAFLELIKCMGKGCLHPLQTSLEGCSSKVSYFGEQLNRPALCLLSFYLLLFLSLSPALFCLHYTSKQLRDIYQLLIYLY